MSYRDISTNRGCEVCMGNMVLINAQNLNEAQCRVEAEKRICERNRKLSID